MKISVVIRTRNSSRTLQDCLGSLVRQTLFPAEVIVVDSGSTDNTLSIAESSGAKIKHYKYGGNFNYSTALNLGVETASSDWILILSSHVILKHPRLIEWMAELISRDEKICQVSARHFLTHLTSEPKSVGELTLETIRESNFFGVAGHNSCAFIRKRSWREYPFNEEIPRCEDQDWAAHFLRKIEGATFIVINNPLIEYKNPYFNFRKELWDLIAIGRYIHPYFLSWGHIGQLLRRSLDCGRQRRFNAGLHHLALATALVFEKQFKWTRISSEYNPKMKSTSP